jgi:hypothetical protein
LEFYGFSEDISQNEADAAVVILNNYEVILGRKQLTKIPDYILQDPKCKDYLEIVRKAIIEGGMKLSHVGLFPVLSRGVWAFHFEAETI